MQVSTTTEVGNHALYIKHRVGGRKGEAAGEEKVFEQENQAGEPGAAAVA